MAIQQKVVVVTINFKKQFNKAVKYTNDTFGKIVAKRFYNKVITAIDSLNSNYYIYQECRYIETPEKSFRSMNINGYSIIYQILETKIRVFKLIHHSRNPKRISTIRKK